MSTQEYTFPNARIGFRNFAGVEGPYNKEGDRSFALFLPEEVAAKLHSEGWNVKFPKDQDPNDVEDTREAYISVSVAYNNFPPKVYLITAQKTGEQKAELLNESQLAVLDWSEFHNIDLIVNPSRWEVNGKKGIKAYLRAGYFVLQTNEFDLKYGV